jgi:hypothetical protein
MRIHFRECLAMREVWEHPRNAAGSLGYSDAKVEALYRELATHISALPGVISSSYVNHLPLDTSREQTSLTDESLAGAKPKVIPVDVFRVEPGYLKTMGVPLLRGCDFTQGELDSKAKVIVVNGALALRLWPGQNPIRRGSSGSGLCRALKYQSLSESMCGSPTSTRREDVRRHPCCECQIRLSQRGPRGSTPYWPCCRRADGDSPRVIGDAGSKSRNSATRSTSRCPARRNSSAEMATGEIRFMTALACGMSGLPQKLPRERQAWDSQ